MGVAQRSTHRGTYDWYAQDKAGNVWYSARIRRNKKGKKASKDGSWEPGIDGAKPRIVMNPTLTRRNTGRNI